jgi:hypothetical protein
MKNLKTETKKRIYNRIIKLVNFIDNLQKDSSI